jgi:shikimate dehydrogenase
LIAENPSLLGLGVTIPYKELVLDFVDEQSPEVQAIGATNSIKIKDGKLTAYNTDIIGFEESFKKKLIPSHKKGLVLGTGGASKAVQYVLAKLGIEYLVVTRNKEEKPGHITYNQVDEGVIADHPLIINCTPLGMFPDVHTCPQLPYAALTSQHYLYDLVYKPDKTVFLKHGEAAGAIVQNGYEMLIIQAEASWKIWNDL